MFTVFRCEEQKYQKLPEEVAISEKTTTRRLTRMKDARILDFSIECSPSVMVGYIQFAIPITTTKFHRQECT